MGTERDKGKKKGDKKREPDPRRTKIGIPPHEVPIPHREPEDRPDKKRG